MTEEDFKKMYSDTDVYGVRYFTMNKIIKDFIQNANILEELEKENAELKERADKADLDSVTFFNQLCKAKEIIKTMLGFMQTFGYSPSMDKFVTDAEDFIKE